MEINLKKNQIQTSELIYEGNISSQIENDITLPDYCPDILRVLKCFLIPGITSAHISGNRITVDGNAVLRIIYSDENGSLSSYENSLQYSKYIENDNITQDSFSIVKSKTEYVNCRVISPRKVDIHGSVNLQFKVFSKNNLELLCDVDNDNIQLKKIDKNIVVLNNKIEKSFSLSEVIELPENTDSVKSIIDVSAIATTTDLKNIKNKFLLKGNLNITLKYCSKNEENEIKSFTHSMPINQIIESENVDEGCDCHSYLDVQSLEIICKTDSSGEERILEINSKISSVISIYKEENISIIKDAYSITNTIEKSEKNIEIKQLLSNISNNKLIHHSLDLQNLGIKKIISVWHGNINTNTTIESNNYKISGTVDVHILGFDNENQPIYLERQIDYEYTTTIDTSANKITSTPNIQITSFEYNQQGKNLDLKFELYINLEINIIEFEKVIDGIIINEAEENRNQNHSLTIYFSDEGESVWNIAKKYNTTVEAIMLENGLNDETILEKRMLLIPAI